MNKKNLDRLFQEKFKDFEAKPNKNVWQNIQGQLKEEKDDKPILIIPFWIKLSGIAVSLVLALIIGNSLYSSKKEPIPIIVDSPKKPKNNTNNKTTSPYLPKQDVKKNNSKKEDFISESNQSKIKLSNNNLANTGLKTSISSLNNNKDENSNQINSNLKTNTIVSLSKEEPINNTKTNGLMQKNSPSNNLNTIKSEEFFQDANTTLAENTSENKNTTSTLEEDAKEENAIETIIAENEESNNEKEKGFNRWSVYANAAPVYYNSFGKGSSIDEQFIDNSKTGEINVAYGLKVGYALNNKIKIRTGINKLNLSYDTNDVIVYQNISNSPKTMRNVSFNQINNLDINVISGNESFLQIPNLGFVRNVSLSQNISYYEIPLEVEYNLIDKKVSLNIIGGVSSFFLENNELVSEFEGNKTKIGEANNLNDVSFSTNLGIGLYFNFTQYLQLNIEPTFKYQINAYNNTSGDFNPYIIGLYSGLSYKF